MFNQQLFDALMQAGAPMYVGAAEGIFDEGDTADGAYLIASGRVSLSFRARTGNSMWSHSAGRGAILSLAPAIAGWPHVFTAVTLEETEMSFIAREELRKLVFDNPALGVDIVCAISAEAAALREGWSKLRRKCSAPELEP